jgi:hypothetical protein
MDKTERIRELEAERDDYKERAQMCLELQEVAEAERDEWKAKYESEVRLVDSVEAERDKAVAMADEIWVAREEIRSERDAQIELSAKLVNGASAMRMKTIEECAEAAEWFINVEKFTAREVAHRIRALAQTDEGKDNASLTEAVTELRKIWKDHETE